jgi:hypothetical protein
MMRPRSLTFLNIHLICEQLELLHQDPLHGFLVFLTMCLTFPRLALLDLCLRCESLGRRSPAMSMSSLRW